MAQNKHVLIRNLIIGTATLGIIVTLGYMIVLAMTTRTPGSAYMREKTAITLVDTIEGSFDDEYKNEEAAASEMQISNTKSSVDKLETALQHVADIYDVDQTPRRNDMFCSAVSETTASYIDQYDSALENYSYAKQLIKDDMDVHEGTSMQGLYDDTRRDTYIELEKNAKTKQQQAAVKRYQAELTKANKKIRESYSAARASYALQANNLIAKAVTDNDARLGAYRNAFVTADAKAVKACKAGSGGSAVYVQYNADIVQATKAFTVKWASETRLNLYDAKRSRDMLIHTADRELSLVVKDERATLLATFKQANS